MRVTYASNASITPSNAAANPYSPGPPDGINNRASMSEFKYSRYTSCVVPLASTAVAISCLPQREQHRRVVIRDAVVVHHQRRAVRVAQMPAERELRVVAIAVDAADQHRAADDVDDQLRARQLEIVRTNREAEMPERLGVIGREQPL